MIDYQYLRLQNPWWEDPIGIEKDAKLQEFEKLRFQYQPDSIVGITPHPGDIHVITGPRQTGKSTALKLLIKQLFLEKFPSQHLLFFNCDALSSEKEVIDLVVQFMEEHKKHRTIIMLDEISSISRWPYAVKWLADTGILTRTTLFLTGSSSINLKKSGELMPGRRGKGKDIAMLPLSFGQYVRLLGDAVPRFPLEAAGIIRKLTPFDGPLRNRYNAFLKTGGFLRTINYGIEEPMNELYLQTLKSDLFKSGKKEDHLREVVRKLLASLSSQTSYTAIAEEAELGSKNTAIDYLAFLSDSFFIAEVKHYDIHQKRVVLKKNKKFYPTDLYVLWLLQGFISGSLNFSVFPKLFDEATLAETFVATELYKTNVQFFYYHNSREMDFYIPRKEIGVEVKWKHKITNEDIKPLEAAKVKILISKHTLEKRDNTLIIPAHLFPLLSF